MAVPPLNIYQLQAIQKAAQRLDRRTDFGGIVLQGRLFQFLSVRADHLEAVGSPGPLDAVADPSDQLKIISGQRIRELHDILSPVLQEPRHKALKLRTDLQHDSLGGKFWQGSVRRSRRSAIELNGFQQPSLANRFRQMRRADRK